MERLVITFVLFFCVITVALLFLIIVLSGALLIFSRKAERVKQNVNPLMEPEKRAA